MLFGVPLSSTNVTPDAAEPPVLLTWYVQVTVDPVVTDTPGAVFASWPLTSLTTLTTGGSGTTPPV